MGRRGRTQRHRRYRQTSLNQGHPPVRRLALRACKKRRCSIDIDQFAPLCDPASSWWRQTHVEAISLSLVTQLPALKRLPHRIRLRPLRPGCRCSKGWASRQRWFWNQNTGRVLCSTSWYQFSGFRINLDRRPGDAMGGNQSSCSAGLRCCRSYQQDRLKSQGEHRCRIQKAIDSTQDGAPLIRRRAAQA